MQTLPSWPYPRFVAHRGGGALAPENTLTAMRTGHRMGYKMVEFDAKLSQDLVAILLHDSNLDRTTNGSGNASEHSFSALAQLDAGQWFGADFAGETIPTLSAISRYTLAQQMASNVEIKPTPGLEGLTGTLIARQVALEWRAAPQSLLLSSFAFEALEAAKKEAPDLPRGWLSAELDADWRQTPTRLGCVSLHLLHSLLTPTLVQDVHAAGFRLAAWTVNDPARATELLAWGVDTIITDALDLIRPE